MKLTNLTRRAEIGANSYLIEAAGQRLVLDSGMHPKEEGEEALPNFRALGDRALDAIIISHSHLDHIGTLPVLMRRQPDARIFMTEATTDIGSGFTFGRWPLARNAWSLTRMAWYPVKPSDSA